MLDRIHEYLEEITPDRPPVLAELEAYAAEHGFPIIGPLVGRFLYQLALTMGARRVLELGSGFGYSAYWFSLAMGAAGEIVMTDTDEANRERALEMFARAGLESRFDFRLGEALQTAAGLAGPFDVILNDIDKEDYPRTIDEAARLLRPGGVFVTDNVIWDGKVLKTERDDATEAIVRFTRQLYSDRRFFTTVLPLRDGISVAVRV